MGTVQKSMWGRIEQQIFYSFYCGGAGRSSGTVSMRPIPASKIQIALTASKNVTWGFLGR